MSEHLSTLDTEPDMLAAFSSFDEDDRGFVKGSELRKALKESGDIMTDAEVRFRVFRQRLHGVRLELTIPALPRQIDRLLSGPFMDKHGQFNYRLFCQTLRVAEGDEEGGL